MKLWIFCAGVVVYLTASTTAHAQNCPRTSTPARGQVLQIEAGSTLQVASRTGGAQRSIAVGCAFGDGDRLSLQGEGTARIRYSNADFLLTPQRRSYPTLSRPQRRPQLNQAATTVSLPSPALPGFSRTPNIELQTITGARTPLVLLRDEAFRPYARVGADFFEINPAIIAEDERGLVAFETEDGQRFWVQAAEVTRSGTGVTPGCVPLQVANSGAVSSGMGLGGGVPCPP